jgi:hypothetical protein
MHVIELFRALFLAANAQVVSTSLPEVEAVDELNFEPLGVGNAGAGIDVCSQEMQMTGAVVMLLPWDLGRLTRIPKLRGSTGRNPSPVLFFGPSMQANTGSTSWPRSAKLYFGIRV